MASNELHFGSTHDGDHPDREDEWATMRAKHMLAPEDRPVSTARGVHHQALISSDVERTIAFYQGLLEFPLTELFENRDYVGSTHFFFDIGNGNALAFFDFPGLGLEDYAEVLGGHHHLAISVSRENWERLKAKLALLGVQARIQRVTVNGKGYHRVRTGPYKGKQEVNKTRALLSSKGFESIAIKLK